MKKEIPPSITLKVVSVGILALVFAFYTLICGATPRFPEDLITQTTAQTIICSSPWLKVTFSRSEPKMTFLSVDATGKGHHSSNLLKSPVGCAPAISAIPALIAPSGLKFAVTINGNVVRYSGIKLCDSETDAISFSIDPKSIKITIDRDIRKEYDASDVSLLRFIFDATVTPVSPLGLVREGELGKLQFPVLLHFPDWGSLLVRAFAHGGEEASWQFSLLRDLIPVKPGAVAEWRDMTPEERKKMEQIGNRNLLQQNRIHLGPEQIQLDLKMGQQTSRQKAGNNASNSAWKSLQFIPMQSWLTPIPILLASKRPG